MAKKRRIDDRSDGGPDGLDRVLAQLAEAPPGLHEVEPPSPRLPSGLPPALIDLYARCDGMRLYRARVVLRPADAVDARDGTWVFGAMEGADVRIDDRGRVWRNDALIDDLVCEGTRLDRWLGGVVDALAVLYDHAGELVEDVLDTDGELLPVVRERQLRMQLKRDVAALGPRWRLAHAMFSMSQLEEGRLELEQVVARDPSFAWAWLDLAIISEKLGELTGAVDEARAAVDAAARHPQVGYFHAQLARIAARAGDEATRALAAREAAKRGADLKASQLTGVDEALAAGDLLSARGLVELLRAVWPSDPDVLDRAQRVETAS